MLDKVDQRETKERRLKYILQCMELPFYVFTFQGREHLP